MATLSRTTTISITDTVTAQTLHDLIEQCLITGLTLATLAEGGDPVFAASVGTATPSPSNAPFWFYDDPTDERDLVLRVFAKPWDTWITVGPDRLELPWINSSATSILPGAYVVSRDASQCDLATGATCNVLGFNQSRYPVPPGGIVPAAYYGFGYALWASHASALRGGEGFGVNPTLGRFAGVSGHDGLAVTTAYTPVSGALYGQYLSTGASGASNHDSRYLLTRVFIHGPRTTTIF